MAPCRWAPACNSTGREHSLVRVKQRTNSLLDERGQPLSDALLSVPLAGLTRDAYRTMFSLDDQTLEDGGNAIIQSKGDLGELLFSASAGLADVSSTLAAIGEEANGIYKKRVRKTQIAELKQKLAELKAQREATDTLASTYAGLVATHAQTEAAYDEAMKARGIARTRHDEIARILRALPLADEHKRIGHELAQYADLARPPAEWAAELPQLMIDETRLRTQIGSTQADIVRLAAEIEDFKVDERLLSLSERIAGLADGSARFTTAESDLPRRRTALAEHRTVIATILAALDQAGNEQPETLLLPAPLIGTLRDLIEARSGIDALLQTTQRELANARDNYERANEDKDRLADGAIAIGDAGLAGIDAALARLRRSDNQARLRLAERGIEPVSRRYRAHLDALHPWPGDGEALRAIALPDQRQMDAWRLAAAAIAKRRTDHAERLRELETKQHEDSARVEAIRAMAGAIDDAEALRIRTGRDAAWERHLTQLDRATAHAFEQHMRADDTLGAARLARTQDLADLRQLTQALSVTAANAERQQDLLAEANGELAHLAAQIRKAVAPEIALPPDGAIEDWLAHIESWARRRNEALLAWDALQETEQDLKQARSDAEHDIALLAQAMVLAGFSEAEELSPSALAPAAEAALASASGLKLARASADKSLQERERDLIVRQRAVEETKSAAETWEAGWTGALSATWFSTTAPGVGAVREILAALADLPAALRERDQLAQRIATMERDQENFATQLDTILAPLGERLDPALCLDMARDLADRHERAQRDHATRLQKSRELARLHDIQRNLGQELAVHEARKAELTAFFGVETLAEVSAALENAANKARLETRLAALDGQIIAELRAETLTEGLDRLAQADLADLEREAAELTARLDDLDERTKLLFAEKSRAADKLDAIGGDAAVARIEAQRRTIFLEIEEMAVKYLRLKTGALVAEKALRAYRDKHRSSMMNRASDAFRLITRGEYSGLAARPEKDRETLIGLPRLGGSKMADDMSKGTQFQLYLALRLAGYQEFALARPSVPFIADDIMETFDEPRSEEVFRLFAEMAKIGQVIYLTHHRHLCDLARAVVPGVRIHEIPA